jgi:hypothetical protein
VNIKASIFNKLIGNNEEFIIPEPFVEKTGYDSVKWLTDFCMDNNLELPRFLVHSQNPVGKENIEKFLENFKLFQQKNK